MPELYAQGDLLIEKVADLDLGARPHCGEVSRVVLAEGERTGHCHVLEGKVAFFRDDGLAMDLPTGLYIGHVKVTDGTARISHEEHGPIALPRGTYRIRRQREFDPKEARLVAD
ncbi:MAG: hypothetical protein F9K44_08765 [Hyphomicrobiaceae bacterium]|nr:MAG: hypothetical protein F9K44_08765 [Hyphomicrobiaceae bacterium]